MGCYSFADGVAILAKTRTEMQNKLTIWFNVLNEERMKMNIDNRKQKVEQAMEYKYLGA